MAYDEQLAARIREMFADGWLRSQARRSRAQRVAAVELELREQAMFGGLAFLVADRIAVAASSGGGLLVRVGVARAEEVLRTTAAQPMEMGGRTMRGWVHVDGEQVRSRRRLGEWIDVGIAAATAV